MGYNRVFGYYYEVTRASHSGPMPEHFIRRQTLANAERFTTVQLKELEEELLSAADKRKSLEYKMFQDLREHMARQRERIVHMADLVAQLDTGEACPGGTAEQLVPSPAHGQRASGHPRRSPSGGGRHAGQRQLCAQ